ncbi:hypothetical protein LCGC14_0801500 [marine sediment metagenome]|uniref:Uncharacterized protein n=1 Tax=marine sediment metagenome TaxID=412755 RepID=A0A0F9Q9C9_9ZZZZ
MKWWNEKLKYTPWLNDDYNQLSKLSDFKDLIDVSDDNLGEKEVKALLKQSLKLKDRTLIDRINEYISSETPIKKRTLNNIVKELTDHGSEKKEEQNSTIKEQEFTKEETAIYEEWLSKPEHEKYAVIDEIIDFYAVGEKDKKNIKLIFFNLFGCLIPEKIVSNTNYHGDPSSGKSYGCDIVHNYLLPNERIWKMDGGSDKIIRYRDEPFDIIYLREMKKDMNLIEDMKSVGDDDSTFEYVDFQQKRTITKQIERSGIITTYSYEATQRDYEDRSWNLTSEQSYEKIKSVKKFRLDIRKNKLQRYIQEKRILDLSAFVKNIVRYFVRRNVTKVVIPFTDLLDPIFSNRLMRVLRDVDKLPDLIEIITIFNQNNRDTFEYDGNTWLISEFADLNKALSIGLDYFASMSLDLDPVKKDILDFMEKEEIYSYKGKGGMEIEDLRDKYYTVKEIHQHIIQTKSQHQNTTYNKLKKLRGDGYISVKKVEGKKAFLYHKEKHYEDLKLDLDEIQANVDHLVEQYKLTYKITIEEEEEKLNKKGSDINE